MMETAVLVSFVLLATQLLRLSCISSHYYKFVDSFLSVFLYYCFILCVTIFCI